jgi:hypothetical protein
MTDARTTTGKPVGFSVADLPSGTLRRMINTAPAAVPIPATVSELLSWNGRAQVQEAAAELRRRDVQRQVDQLDSPNPVRFVPKDAA